MAEVATNASHTSAGVLPPPPAITNNASQDPKSPPGFKPSPSSTPRAEAQSTLQEHHQSLPPPSHLHQHLPPPQPSNRSPIPQQRTHSPRSGDVNTATTAASPAYSQQHWPSPGPIQFSSVDRSLSRTLPPMMSPLMGLPPPVSIPSNNEQQQLHQLAPISPRTVPMGLNEQLPQDLAASDLATPRKRSKVSRACDECRRKKIRCDASSETGIEQCSSCKRVGSKCSFSRVPMKRGPSKGYIKELADRLNTLENSISTGDMLSYGPGIPGEGDHSPGPSDSTSPPPGSGSTAKNPRKRTLSSSGDFHNHLQLQPLTQQASMTRPNERLPSIDSFHPPSHQHPPSRQIAPPQSIQNHQKVPGPPPPLHSTLPSSASSDPGSLHRKQPSPNGMGYWSDVGDRRSSITFPFDSTDSNRASVLSTPKKSADAVHFEWDEDAINQYYDIIHPTFPLLPHSRASLRSRLSAAPQKIREAFLEALYSTLQMKLGVNSSTANAKTATELCVQAQFESPNVRTPLTNLIHLQTLILMALEADNHGPATIRGNMGPPRSAWLGAAVGLAYHLKLHSNRIRENLGVGDPDSDDKLGRRAWWSLVVLDRWQAISTSSPTLIPDSSIALLPEDQNLLGAEPYHIVRLSCILGHLAEALTMADETSSSSTGSPYVSKLMRGQLERFRESIDSIWNKPSLVHATYYHVKLLALRHGALTDPQRLLEPAQRIAAFLDSPKTPITPLNHHFAALALLTFADLAEIKETQEEAWKGIEQLMEALEKRRRIHSREESFGWGWDRAIKDLIEKRKQARYTTGSSPRSGHRGNLQHLAELAVGERTPRTPSPASTYIPPGGPLRPISPLSHTDFTRLQHHGYLGALVV